MDYEEPLPVQIPLSLPSEEEDEDEDEALSDRLTLFAEYVDLAKLLPHEDY